MKPKFIIVSIGVIIAVATIVILASVSGTRFRRSTAVTYSGTYSGAVTVVAVTNGMVTATNSTAVSQTNITPQTK